MARGIPATHGDLRLHAYSMDDRDDMYISAAGILTEARGLHSQVVSAAVELMDGGVSFRDTTSIATFAQTDFDELTRVSEDRRMLMRSCLSDGEEGCSRIPGGWRIGVDPGFFFAEVLAERQEHQSTKNPVTCVLALLPLKTASSASSCMSCMSSMKIHAGQWTAIAQQKLHDL